VKWSVARGRESVALDTRAIAPVLAAISVGWLVIVVYPMRHDPMGFALSWAVMSLAMMVPTVMRPMMRVAQGKSSRAVGFALGYLAIWTVSAVPAWVVMTWLPVGSLSLAVAWIAVGAYAQAPFVLKSFHSCRSLPTSSRAMSTGLRQGLSCVIGCAPLMVVVMATIMQMNAGPLIAASVMFAAMWVMIWQKAPSTQESSLRAVGVALVIGGALLGVTGDFSGHQHMR
jgi:hypothetical protein